MERTSALNPPNTSTQGWINGLIGVVIFSGSLPATRLAVMEFDPVFLTMLRATLAALVGLLLLGCFKVKRPAGRQWAALAIVSLGVVIGFPLLTALALQYVHVGALHRIHRPAAPGPRRLFWRPARRASDRVRCFWLFSILGSALVMG